MGGILMDNIYELLAANPIIGALPHMVLPNELEQRKIEVFFLLSGNIMEIYNRVSFLKDSGKKVFVHVDLIDGLAKDIAAIDYIQKHIKPNIIHPKSSITSWKRVIATVQRFS